MAQFQREIPKQKIIRHEFWGCGLVGEDTLLAFCMQIGIWRILCWRNLVEESHGPNVGDEAVR
jgi:hypothetical protein